MPDTDDSTDLDLPPVLTDPLDPPAADPPLVPSPPPADDAPPALAAEPEAPAESPEPSRDPERRPLATDVVSRAWGWWSRRVRLGEFGLRGEDADRFDTVLLEGLSRVDLSSLPPTDGAPEDEPSLTLATNERGQPNATLSALLRAAGVTLSLPPYLCMKITEHDVRVL